MWKQSGGFTLIELSIVLVIIGLIVGGVLVGQDLIRAAGVRAQVSQIEKYNAAVNTFRGKFGGLPGDVNSAAANQYGLSARGLYAGQGDGNGVMEGVFANAADSSAGDQQTAGETVLFWRDLSITNLIDGSFAAARANNPTGTAITSATSPSLADFFPAAKIGQNNAIYVFSDGDWDGSTWTASGTNYFGLTVLTAVRVGAAETYLPGLTALQAFGMDSKTDDGRPQTGRATARAIVKTGSGSPLGWSGAADMAATAASPTTCYDNGSIAGAVQKYSFGVNGGSGVNCSLSFQFQ